MLQELTFPQVVQALMDGKTVRNREGHTHTDYRVNSAHDLELCVCGSGWRLDTTSLKVFLRQALLGTKEHWEVLPERYDWNEARKRMAMGKAVRRVDSSEKNPDERRITCILDGRPPVYYDRYGGSFVFGPDDFDGQWEDA